MTNLRKIIVFSVFVIMFTLVVGVIGYASWYEWNRVEKIAYNEACEATTARAVADSAEDTIPNLPCAYELVPPTLWELFGGAGKDGAIGPVMIHPCDQSATTSDCSVIMIQPDELPLPGGPPITRYPYTTAYPLLDSFYKVNDHLSIDSSLWTLPVESCGADMRTRGILIDHTEVISRIFFLTLREPDAPWAQLFCGAVTDLRERVTGARERTVTNDTIVLETKDPIIFSGSDFSLPGTAYRVFIDGHHFIVIPGTGRIYTSSAFDGDLGEDIGGLWDEYENSEVGLTFSYPYTGGNQGKWRTAAGETGRIWGAAVGLPEYGASITLSAKTGDYTASKGGQLTPTEGFVEQNGGYYPLWHGVPAGTAFVPDEVWSTADGKPILVKFAKRETYDFAADYPEPSIQAIMNLDGSEFTGVGVWFAKDGSVFPTAEDIELFKRIVTSLQITQ